MIRVDFAAPRRMAVFLKVQIGFGAAMPPAGKYSAFVRRD
jgi:hypothetical protein